MKFGIKGEVADVVRQILVSWFRGYGVFTTQNCYFPRGSCVAPTTVLHYRAIHSEENLQLSLIIYCAYDGPLESTRGSGVADGPPDASCLSVDSFSSTIPRAQFLLSVTSASSDLPVRTMRFYSVVFGVKSSLAVIHTIHGRPWLCIARDRVWSVSHCTQSRTTVTAYSA